MSTAGVSPVEQSWQKFLMDVELAKHFEDVALLGMALGVRSPANPLLEVLLPSLLYVRLGSVIDEALCAYIDTMGLNVKPHKDNFNDRIRLLEARGVLHDAAKLDRIRARRNELAHETTVYDASQPNACGWPELDQAIGSADDELQHLNLVGARPAYRFHAGQEIRSSPGVMSKECFYELILD
jgi:hypothetical protein